MPQERLGGRWRTCCHKARRPRMLPSSPAHQPRTLRGSLPADPDTSRGRACPARRGICPAGHACGGASLRPVDVRGLAGEERADLAAFLSSLTPEQWQAPTLCPGWRVRDVVAHVISYDDQSLLQLLSVAARAGSG